MRPNHKTSSAMVGAPRSVHRQRGAAQLFITIVLLVVIMMLGITATILSTTQFRLAGNLQFENQAFEKAESAASVALGWLATGTNAQNASFGTGAIKYLYPKSPTIDPLSSSSINWDNNDSLDVSGDGTQRYIIQQIGIGNHVAGTMLNIGDTCNSVIEGADVYRITARGTSAKGTTKIVQTNVYVPRDLCKG